MTLALNPHLRPDDLLKAILDVMDGRIAGSSRPGHWRVHREDDRIIIEDWDRTAAPVEQPKAA